MKILVAGATGFVGRALVPALARAGHDVRAAARSRAPVTLDVADDESVARALDGVDVAFWLVHGLKRGRGYPAWERDVAERFASSSAKAGVRRIVYLGGIDPRGGSTKHLESRLATGRALRTQARVDVVELRAGMIVGAGSESWTITRDACARLPLHFAPPWLFARQQPVALDDVVAALVRAAAIGDGALPPGAYDVPGPEQLTGAEIVARTSRLLGRAPKLVPIPLFPRALAGRIAPYVTRADGAVAKELFLGMGLDLTVDGEGVFAHMPGHRRVPFDEAAARAIAADDVSVAAQLYEAMLKRGQRRRSLRRASRAPGSP